jgi:O-acetyl-ADP-ribose deacetylase (regulator of RNase III)
MMSWGAQINTCEGARQGHQGSAATGQCVKRPRMHMAGRWLTAEETMRLQLLATKAERDAFLKLLAKSLRKRVKRSNLKIGRKVER